MAGSVRLVSNRANARLWIRIKMKIKEDSGEWTQGIDLFRRWEIEDGRWGSFVKVNVNESQR